MLKGSKVDWKAEKEGVYSCEGSDFDSLLAWLKQLDKDDFQHAVVKGEFSDEQVAYLRDMGLILR